MKIQSLIRFPSIAFLTALGFVVASSAGGADFDAADFDTDTVDEGNPSDELEADLRRTIDPDTDVVNTALTFHNPSQGRAIVVCAAYDGNGNLLGTKATHIPPGGLRFLRASDIANGVDFVGSAACKSRTRVQSSAILLGPGAVTDLDVQRRGWRRVTSFSYPLVVSY